MTAPASTARTPCRRRRGARSGQARPTTRCGFTSIHPRVKRAGQRCGALDAGAAEKPRAFCDLRVDLDDKGRTGDAVFLAGNEVRSAPPTDVIRPIRGMLPRSAELCGARALSASATDGETQCARRGRIAVVNCGNASVTASARFRAENRATGGLIPQDLIPGRPSAPRTRVLLSVIR